MSIDYAHLFKNFQSVIVSYQDISAIYTKLFSQGQLQKLVDVFTEIYDEEHFFTLTELQRFCKDNNQKEDDFVAEQYELNSNIFRRNLTLITQNLVEEIGRKFLEKFKLEFSGSDTPQAASVKQQANLEQISVETGLEKVHYKSHMPEIREENELSAVTPSAKNAARLLEPEEQEPHFSDNSRNYESNKNDVNQRLQPQQEGRSEKSSPVQLQSQENYAQKTVPKVSPISSAREETYKNAPASYFKSEPSAWNSSEPTRAEDTNQNDEYSSYKVNQVKGQASSGSAVERFNYHWSSPDRTAALVKKTAATRPNNHKGAVPFSAERTDRKYNSFMANSYSKWSLSNGRPDPSILDSEFSYSQGASFSKSPKKFHHDINKVPGPGDYEIDETSQLKSVNYSFIKSPKVPSYFTKSDVPGAIYYPVKHFLSK